MLCPYELRLMLPRVHGTVGPLGPQLLTGIDWPEVVIAHPYKYF
jgi:hypothetical protein